MKRIGTSVIVTRYDEDVLLLKNTRTQCWELPGGKLDEGESIVECAARELKEETDIGSGTLALNFVGYHEHHSRPTFEDEQWLNMIFHYEFDSLSNKINVMEPDKHDEIKWFCIDRLPCTTWNVACNCIIQLLENRRRV